MCSTQVRDHFASQDPQLVDLLISIYLHKWRFHSIFCHLNDGSNDSTLSVLEFERLHRILQLAGELSNSSSLRADAERLMVEDELRRFIRLA